MLIRLKSASILALLCALLLSACSPFGGGTNAPAQNGNNTVANTNVPPIQVLQNAFNAMQQLKTLHVSMSIATDTRSTGNAPQQMLMNIKVEGDVALPDQASLRLSLGQGMGSTPVNMAEVVMGNQIYLQNQKGQWYVLDLGTFTSATGNPFASAQVSNYNTLLPLAQKANIVDNGGETLNGQLVRHLTVNFDKAALQDLLNASGQLNNLQTQQRQDLQKFLQSVNLVDKPTLDLWIDPASSYLQRMELKFALNMPNNVTSSIDSVVDYSRFDQTVNINAPANATPTNNPVDVFK